jgi:uroporphyrinogen decarboxylase
MENLRRRGEEITPEMFLDMPLNDVDNMADYDDVIKALKHHKQERGRFCFIQTFGIFECLSHVFGIEDHLANLLIYPDELHEIYRRQAEWNRKFAENAIELGVDMIHISDDWGAQRGLMFSPAILRDLIVPYHKTVCDFVKSTGTFLSMHNDGNVVSALPAICELGYQVLHPWQESAGVSYDLYLNEYSDKIALMGGVCIQTSLGFGNTEKLRDDIYRVFGLLKGKRWICSTTHFVQEHCSLEELVFAYDLINKLAGK